MKKFILMDVEGTTTSIDFVHEVLFAYAQEKMSSFVNSHHRETKVKEALNLLVDTIIDEEGYNPDLKSQIETLLDWIRVDRKHPALKTIQGFIWQQGYESGEIKGHVYADVLPALKRWQAAKLGLGIYSSGSVLAQKLLFKHSTAGDLTSYFSAHFDTAVGHKREAQSYLKIAAELKLKTTEILFLSDIAEELEAAAEVGYEVIQLCRSDSNNDSPYREESSFATID